ncbi:MAG: nucleoside triphosphate pyrophosphohydrolase [Anaerolineae bacterium]|nr:MAG: nucleoside triphosphate pyrophosphohydrolase [Anaerolineae bacterium]
MKLTIVGLGPGHEDDITRRAWRILHEAKHLYLRTARHPAVAAIQRDYESFDGLYETANNFESLYETIAGHVLQMVQEHEEVAYAVPGHPLVGEQTVTLLLQKAGEIPVEIVDGMSFIEPSLKLLSIDAMAGLQIHDAAEIAQMHHPPLNPDQPALIGQVYSKAVASDVKLTLMNQYPDEHPVVLLHRAGLPDGIRESLALYEIDRSPHIAHLTTLYLPPLHRASSFEYFQDIIAHLRAPDGCPWDKEQTHLSLRPYLMEETYEVLDALDKEDMTALCEELGDLLLQVVLHSQVAIEEGHFTMADILAGISDKIVRRHPHVWGDVEVKTVSDLNRVWETQKQAEKTNNGDQPKSLLEGLPAALPALIQAYKYQKKAAKVGFDWGDIAPVYEKVLEEIEEIRHADNPDERTNEIGDLLFAVVNLARWLEVEPEIALRAANQRFRRRFEYIEQYAGRNLKDMTLAEMDLLWNEAKSKGF